MEQFIVRSIDSRQLARYIIADRWNVLETKSSDQFRWKWKYPESAITLSTPLFLLIRKRELDREKGETRSRAKDEKKK